MFPSTSGDIPSLMSLNINVNNSPNDPPHPPPRMRQYRGDQKPKRHSSQEKKNSQGFVAPNRTASNWRQNQSGSSTKKDHSRERKNSHGFAAPNPTASNRTQNQTGSSTKKDNHFNYRNFIGYKKFEHILKQEPSDMILEIAKIKTELLAFLNEEQKPDIYVMLVSLLSKISHVSFRQQLIDILLLFTNTSSFNTRLCQFIMGLALQSANDRNWNKMFWHNTQSFWTNLVVYCNTVTDLMPHIAVDFVPKLITAVSMVEKSDIHNVGLTDEISAEFDHLNMKLEEVKIKQEKEEIRRNATQMEPPENFRDLEIYPTVLEIKKCGLPFLRENVIEGSYANVEQYLDIHFRLLREDFVSPLRQGIQEYLDQSNVKGRKRLSNIKIYRDVEILGAVNTNSQVGYKIQAFKKQSIKNLENTRRLMFGSLVCLTCDNFDNIIFGTILDRDLKLLREGQIVIGLQFNVDLKEGMKFIMAECTVYFEPYYQVLKALKTLNEENFPLRRYLINVDCTTEMPDYLMNHGMTMFQHYQHDDLNDSQLNAYRNALRSKFSIIQGPPGTGKTFLGLKIAETLLTAKYVRGPILVVCFTNHALDQFLEGLLRTTETVVRVGGRSKNKNLDKYNIREWRKRMAPSVNSRRAFYEARQRLEANQVRIEQCMKERELINNYLGILPLSRLVKYPNMSDSEFFEWLLENNEDLGETQTTTEVNNANNENEANGEEETEVYDENLFDRNYNLDIDDEADEGEAKESQSYNLTLESLKISAVENFKRLSKLKEGTHEYNECFYELLVANNRYQYLSLRLNELKLIKTQPPMPYMNNINILHPDLRWKYYAHLLFTKKKDLLDEVTELDKMSRNLYEQYSEVRDMADLYILRASHVIGMTTTGSARMSAALQELKCPIVIVEEAAEVLEAHVVTALSDNCQQLILIGDHKQLRPSTADYKMETDFKLGISLFERMVMNKVQCNTLLVQHRMHPKIAKLVSPIIYPELINHHTVRTYPEIRGIDKNLFFIHHTNAEAESFDSKLNKYEAEFMIKFARYLVLNNLEAKKITLLVAYSAQFFEVTALRRKHDCLKNLNVQVLDNYQGEENDVILLSLVRNNADGNVGFLRLENRICVALSRAKHGMYIMGNIDMLEAKSNIWKQVRVELEEQQALGTSLMLRCQKHFDQETEIKELADFDKVVEGGCQRMCEETLNCGHICKKICHPTSHENYTCFEMCGRILCEFNHICMKRCYQTCGECMVPKQLTLPCGHEIQVPCHKQANEVECPVEVMTELPCKHNAMKPCHYDPAEFPCPEKCETRLECGHACVLKCHIFKDPDHLQYKCMKVCDRPNAKCSLGSESTHLCKKRCCDPCGLCRVEMLKSRTLCNHKYKVTCSTNADDIQCEKPCKRIMDCGHQCTNKCFESCGPCLKKTSKDSIDCSHKIDCICNQTANRAMCKQPCNKLLPCLHRCNLRCKDDCSKAKCKVLSEDPYKKLACGHKSVMPCYLLRSRQEYSPEVLDFCKEPCGEFLKCGHLCHGTCGGCKQGRLHVSCKEKCPNILVCGHECKVDCRQICQPCQIECTYQCQHSRCKKKCGAPCSKCKEPCTRQCSHQKCTRLCSDPCNVKPCNEPCMRRLNCGHTCVGFCGEICPKLCIVCNKEELTEIFFGYEDEPNARFIQLDCGHIFESEGLNGFFDTQVQDTSVKMINCPRCKSSCLKSQRFAEYIRSIYKDIEQVKWKLCGNEKSVEDRRRKLLADFNNLYTANQLANKILETCRKNLNVVKHERRQFFFIQRVDIYEKKYEVLKELINSKALSNNDKDVMRYTENVLKFISDEKNYMSEQQIHDLNLELLRINRLLILIGFSNKQLNLYKECYNKITHYKPYNKDGDKQLLDDLKRLKGGLQITDQERKEILSAMGFTQGHWFKCSKGHIYCIGECGGAMQVAKCPECGDTIGGQNHALTRGNQVATEMDGSRYGAFSNEMNLGNYDPRDFM